MTIHKAKGLEFDTVIVPGLAAGGGKDERKLFLWMETPESSLLVAPINPTGSDEDEIYELIRDLDKRMARHEMGRLLYVAATRARRRLHLFGDVGLDDHGAPREPAKGTLLHTLWPVVSHASVSPATGHGRREAAAHGGPSRRGASPPRRDRLGARPAPCAGSRRRRPAPSLDRFPGWAIPRAA
jgi:ATP-dependent exoDNAse (exonuclease V) beta subunit